MSRHNLPDQDSHFESMRDRRNPRKQPRRPQPDPRSSAEPKQSYEQSPQVQHWLAEHGSKRPGDKPPFDPPFLSAHHERVWLLSSLEQFYQRDLIVDVVSVAKSGKEATVYCCAADPLTGYALLAAKTYRPRMFRSLRNDAVYRHNRASLDERGRFSRRARRSGSSEAARTEQVMAWIQHEYQIQQRVHEAGADVPAVFGQAGNAILMEYIGDDGGAAPLLQHARLHPSAAPALFAQAMINIELLLRCHCIHGDLSAYNILYWQERLILIDFAQAVDPRLNLDVYELLERDIARVCQHFARYGVAADPQALAGDLWTRYLMGDLAA